ncbi:hypothetical protein M2119_001245 [Aurantimicrobium minutum]|uniref:hypothetical protein n=1 Tax=Aurantimicrobium minutum TaxID=708131 RepID=UPI002476634F|nr:hypothetical protein [Aurantimicrobium minutum]MDH6533008.1 hypothetical protein [Aurantimicrobium minutum]
MLHTVRMGFLFHPLNFAPAEISAMRLDGDITPEGTFVDTPDDWISRVNRALWGHSRNAVLTGLSAAWALGGHSEPEMHTVTALPGHSHGMTPRMNFRSEERTLGKEDVWSVDGLGVTTPLRTLSDLLRDPDVSPEYSKQVSREIMQAHHITATQLRNYILDMKYVPYSRWALKLTDAMETN